MPARVKPRRHMLRRLAPLRRARRCANVDPGESCDFSGDSPRGFVSISSVIKKGLRGVQNFVLCKRFAITSTLMIDEDGCYDPAEFNDGLVLGDARQSRHL